MIRYLDAFEDYNPLTDELDEDSFWEVGYIEQQARSILPKDFTLADLNAGLEFLFQLRASDSNASFEYTRSFQENEKYNNVVFSSAPLNYYLCTSSTEIPKKANGEPYLWSWLFAVLALASISDYVSLKNKAFDPKSGQWHDIDSNDETGLLDSRLVDRLPLEAMEALGFSREFLAQECQHQENGENLYSDVDRQQREKERGEKISKTKLKHYEDVKIEIFRQYAQLDEGISNRQAAKLIYPKLDERLQCKLNGDPPELQIEKWIGQYKKGSLSGQELLPPF